MDEIFHVPQACSIFNGNFSHYDSAITTPPGLYVASLIYLNAMKGIRPIVYDSSICTLENLRLFNVLILSMLPIVSLAARKSVKRLLNLPYSSLTYVDCFQAFLVSFNPILFNVSFLYYTDCLSLLLMLACFCLMSEHHTNSLARRLIAILVFGFAIFVRQDNIIWAGFFIFLNVKLVFPHRDGFTQMKTINLAIRNIIDIVYSYFEWFLCVLMFIAYFVLLRNRQFVVGHSEHHKPVLHLMQIFYFTVFISILQFPSLLAILVKHIKRIAFISCLVIVLSLIALICIRYCTYEHIFLISDNRHISFYIWRRAIRIRHWSFKYLYSLIYACGLILTFLNLLSSTNARIMFAFCISCIVYLSIHELLEFRYFIVPYSFYLILSNNGRFSNSLNNIRSIQCVTLELAISLCITLSTLWLFLKRPLYFDSNTNETQRLMW
ncbi:hypothetical protein GJ496_005977 [Pomphorhynchus laevis]|nr:hypothetical protein GJ496_005977 [Pomphorhynchus laevis]